MDVRWEKFGDTFMTMKRCLHQITVHEAVTIIKNISPRGSSYHVPVVKSVGHKLAESLYAHYSVPEVPVSAMDGFAIRSTNTIDAKEQTPIHLREFVRLNTGNVIPKEFDAVVRVEDALFDGDDPNEIVVRKLINPGTNVRTTGEDIKKGQLILPAGTVIRSFDVGAIASYGITHVNVSRISVGILPTGTELILPGTRPLPGQVVESNTTMAEAYISEFGVEVARYPPVGDNPVLIREALKRLLSENDIAIVSAGSSAGTKDFTASVIADMGKLLFHGVAMKPAKPAMFGVIEGKPVFGLPGYPLSAQTVLRLFVRELLEEWGWKGPVQDFTHVQLGDSISSDGDVDEFSLHAAARVGNRYVVIPQSRGASVQMTGIRSNVVIHIPHGVEGFEAGNEVTALLTVPREELDKTVLIAGVYDPVLDTLAEAAMKADIRVRTGNFSGSSDLLLLLKNCCHAVCITDSADLTMLNDTKIFIRSFKTKKHTTSARLVYRAEMEGDPLMRKLFAVMDSTEF
jgi:putative molybdopterin biosynthesis protein